jgi:energy-coupling factor transporter ATP-binding protein EcfA2
MKLTTTAKLAQIRVGLRSGEDVWITPQDGLNLIYGKNGSGKSTVLSSICKLFLHPLEEKGPEESVNESDFLKLATAYFEIESVIVVQLYDSLLSSFQKHLVEVGIDEPLVKKRFRSRTSSIADAIKHGITNPLIDFGVIDESETVGLNRYLEEFDEWSKSLEIEIDEVYEVMLSLIRDNLQEEGVKIFFDTDDSSQLFDSLRNGIRDAYSEIYSDLSVEQANERLEFFALETRLDQDALSDRSFSGSMWTELLELYLVMLVCDYYNVLKVPASIWDEEKSVEPSTKLVQAAPSLFGIAQTVLQAFENQLDCPTFWTEPSYRSDLKFGQVGLALGRTGANVELVGFVNNVDIQTAAAKNGYDVLHKSLNGEVETTDNSEALFYFNAAENVVTGGFASRFVDRDERFVSFWSNQKYLQLDRRGAFILESTPVQAVLLDRQIDLDHVAQKTFTSLIKNELQTVTFDVDDSQAISDIEFSGESTKYIENFVSAVSKFLARLDIGISRCEFKYSTDLREWTSGKSAEFRFFTGQSAERGIGMSDLSSGQQYWVSAAFQICYAEQTGIRYLIIADEPERGLHQRAVLSAFDSLKGLSATSVISTHSVSALGIAGAHLLHLERGDDGMIRLTEPYLGDDIAEAASRFGTTPFDLFAIKRALVVVEGAHDVEVVKGLAGLSFGGKLLDRLIIVPARGVKNVATIADSVVVTEFTSLHILAIVDNGRAEMLNGIIERASAALREGKSERQAIVFSGIPEYSKDASPEERFMFDLIERAIHRRVINRLHLYALSVPDIVDLLPEKAFNLQNSWSELRAKYKRSGNRDGFKIWLKSEFGVSISSKNVKKAFEGLDTVDGDLKKILDELEIVASLSPFEV